MQIRVGVDLSVCVYVFVYLTVSYTSANCQITKLGKQIRSTTHIHKHLQTHTHRHRHADACACCSQLTVVVCGLTLNSDARQV